MIGTDAGWLAERIRDIPDFPKPGVVYKDITPLLADPLGLELCVAALAEPFADGAVDKVVGIEARGFILAAPVAMRLGAGFVPVRKPGKLPWEVIVDTYDLEYGSDTLEIHRDALAVGERVLVIDDVLATGGTASAGLRLVEVLGATTVGFGCVIELEFLAGRAKLGGLDVVSLLTYP
ncbi:MAG: adenine phosphoribosyltransferase [Actinomycetota bacterium]|nr:adenine phosphoribosyltransferase [Actinomycetota bacterium]